MRKKDTGGFELGIRGSDTLSTELQRYTNKSMGTINFTKDLKCHLVTWCHKIYKTRCSELP